MNANSVFRKIRGVAAMVVALAAPALFAEGAYIQSDGTQAINTGYFINAKTKIEIDFQMTEITSQGRLWGQNGTGCGNNAVVYFGDSASNFKIGYGNTFNGVYLAANNLQRNTIVYDGPGNKGYLYQNGAQVASCDLTAAHNGTATFPMSIFGQSTNAKGASANGCVKMKLYAFKVYEDDALVHDYAPAFKGSITGLVDTVTGTFLYDTRAAGGAFTGSGNLVEIEDDPYIESNGTGAINTGVVASPDLKIELDYALTEVIDPTPESTTSHYQQRIFGQDTVTSTPRISVYINNSTNISIATGDGWNASSTAIAADFSRRTIIIDNVAHVRAFMTGMTTNWNDTCTDIVSTCATRPLGLFGNTSNDNGTTFNQYAKAKVYGLRIWSAGTLIRDFQPRYVNGVAGFEDVVSGAFYTCDGLTASANAPTALSGRSKEGDAYIESDGTSFGCVVDTRYFANPRMKVALDFQLVSLVSGCVVAGNFGSGNTFSCMLPYCSGTTDFILQAKDGTYSSGYAFSPKVSQDLARHTAVIDVPNRHVEMRASDGTVQGERALDGASWSYTKTSNWPLLLFGAADKAYGKYQRLAKARIFSFKVWESNDGANYTLVHYFMPCVKGGVPGFKDEKTGEFFSGNGLTAGGNVSEEDDDPYVENPTGGRYFDTGVYATSNMCIVCDFMLLVQQASPQQFPFEAGDSVSATNANQKMFMRMYGNGSAGTGDYAYACGGELFTSMEIPYVPLSRRRLTLDAYHLVCKVETPSGLLFREKAIAAKGRTVNPSSKTIKLLANANLNGNSCKARLYGFKIYEEGALIRDYVPICQAGEYALLDKVEGKVLAKASAAAFTGFTANNALNESFFNAPMRNEDAYIESDGTQGINLGYFTTPNTRYEIDYQFNDTTAQSRAFGEATGALSAELYIQGTGKVAFGVGDTWKAQETGVAADLNRHVAVLDFANHECGYSGYRMFAFDSARACTKTATIPMWLFAKGTNASGSYSNLATMKLYAFRIFESGTLVHEYLPYKNGDVVGLYDTMTGDVITSTVSGSNAFTFGGGLGYGKFAGVKKDLVVEPSSATISVSGSKTLEAFAPGAVRYVWTRDGDVIADANGLEVKVDWEHRKSSAGPLVYGVTPVFLVGGEEVLGAETTAEVTMTPAGMTLLVR